MNQDEALEEQNEVSCLSMPEVVKNIRSSAKLTQAELAERLDTTRARVSRFERGTAKPKYDEVGVLRDISRECKTGFDRVHESLELKTLAELAGVNEGEDREEKKNPGLGDAAVVGGLVFLLFKLLNKDRS